MIHISISSFKQVEKWNISSTHCLLFIKSVIHLLLHNFHKL